MRISEIGKAKAGLTLLEVLGVILLIGLTLTLARPEIFQAAAKSQARYAGRLLQADLERIRAEVKAGAAVAVEFNAGGYRFALGETEVVRDYRDQGLTFKAEGAGVVLTPATSEAGAADAGETADATAEQAETGAATSELRFVPGHEGPLATIIWQNKRYQGVVTLQADGAASWGYHAK